MYFPFPVTTTFNLVEHLEAQSKKKRTTVPLGSEPTLGHKDKMQMIGPKGLPPRSVRFPPFLRYGVEWSAVEVVGVVCLTWRLPTM